MNALFKGLCVLFIISEVYCEILNNKNSTETHIGKIDKIDKQCAIQDTIEKMQKLVKRRIEKSDARLTSFLNPDTTDLGAARKPRENSNNEQLIDWKKCISRSEFEEHKVIEHEHIAILKKELFKLQELVRLLRDQQYILDILDDFDKSKNFKSDNEVDQEQLIQLLNLLKQNLPTSKNATINKTNAVQLPNVTQAQEVRFSQQSIPDNIKKEISEPPHMQTTTKPPTQIEQLQKQILHLERKLSEIAASQSTSEILGAVLPQNLSTPSKPHARHLFSRKSSEDESNIESLLSLLEGDRAKIKKDSKTKNLKIQTGNDDLIENLQRLLDSTGQTVETKEISFDTDLESRLVDLEKQLRVQQKLQKLEKKIKQLHTTDAETKTIDEDDDIKSQLKKLQIQLKKMDHVQAQSKDLDEEDDILEELKSLQSAIKELRPKESLPSNQPKKGSLELELMLNKLFGTQNTPLISEVPSPVSHSQLSPAQVQLLKRKLMTMKVGGGYGDSYGYPSFSYGQYPDGYGYTAGTYWPSMYGPPIGRYIPDFTSYGIGNKKYAYDNPYQYEGKSQQVTTEDYRSLAPYPLQNLNNQYSSPTYQPYPKPPSIQYSQYKKSLDTYQPTQVHSDQVPSTYSSASVPKNNFFPGNQQSYQPAKSYNEANTAQPYVDRQQNTVATDSYSQGKVGELKTQIYSLQNAISNLNRPEYIQKPEDQEAVYNLDQKITDLKQVVSHLNEDNQNVDTSQGYAQRSARTRHIREAPKEEDKTANAMAKFFDYITDVMNTIGSLLESNENNRPVRQITYSKLMDHIVTNLFNEVVRLMNIADNLSQNILNQNCTCSDKKCNLQRRKRQIDKENIKSAWNQMFSFLKDITDEDDELEKSRNNRQHLQEKLEELKKQLDMKLRSPAFNQRSHQSSNIAPYYHQPLIYYYPQHTSYEEQPEHSKTKKKKPKKEDAVDKAIEKIVDKIVDKVVDSVPSIIKRLLNTDFGHVYEGDDYNYGIQKQHKGLGIFGFIPMFILNLISNLNYFIKTLQKNKFVRTFLVPALVTAGSAGLVIFLVWWLSTDDDQYYYDYGNDGYRKNSNIYSGTDYIYLDDNRYRNANTANSGVSNYHYNDKVSLDYNSNNDFRAIPRNPSHNFNYYLRNQIHH